MERPAELDLSGRWRAAPAGDDELRRRYADDDLDDTGWELLDVPGHWRSSPAFADHDGGVVYRTRFDAAADGPDDRAFLVLDGVAASSDVWLDGTYLGDTAGWCVPHAFEVTELLAARAEHLLALEVSCAPVGPGPAGNLLGALGRSALLGAGHDPGGIWRPVRLERTGPVRIRYARLRCPEASPERAVLALRVVLDVDEPRTVTLRTSVAPSGRAGEPEVVVEREQPLATGENRVEWRVPVAEPDLWWPRALGDQPLHDVRVEVLVDDEVSHHRSWRTGLRQVRMRDFALRVNGEQLFLKGVSVGPTRALPAEASPEEVAADVELAADAGLDLLRVHGHLARPELYEAADRLGMLVWQDLPLQWAVSRTVKSQARRMARAAVDQLAHHPSVAVWCAHHEPWDGDPGAWRTDEPAARRRARRRRVLAQVLPSWNRTVLDRSVAETLSASDGSRPVVAHSGVWPHPPQMSGTSTHLWAGWRWGRIGDLPRLLRWWPRVGRFVGELGAQAPPGDGSVLDPDGDAAARWPALDWEALADRYALELPAIRRTLPPERHGSLGEWTAAAQAHQAEVVRSHVETLRRLKYHPTGGFAAYALADPAPGATAALLDHRRRPKPAWAALVESCRPTIAVMDRPPDDLVPGAPLDLEVHVVNDQRLDLAELRVLATLAWEDAPDEPLARAGWTGDAPADSVARVGAVHWTVPRPPAGSGAAGATLVLDLELEGPGDQRWRRRHRRTVRAPR